MVSEIELKKDKKGNRETRVRDRQWLAGDRGGNHRIGA